MVILGRGIILAEFIDIFVFVALEEKLQQFVMFSCLLVCFLLVSIIIIKLFAPK